MPGKRDAPEPIGLGLSGHWTQLEPPTDANRGEFRAVEERRAANVEMGAGRGRGLRPFAQPMLVRDRRTGRVVGILESHEMPGRIAMFVAYVDPDLGRAGYGFEALSLYLSHLYDSGAHRVAAEVLGFNHAMIKIMRTVDLLPQARLREHVYTAGRYWDLLIYAFDRDEWFRIVTRYRRMLPGGDRGPAAMGGSRRASR